jgi:hypothetical protein
VCFSTTSILTFEKNGYNVEILHNMHGNIPTSISKTKNAWRPYDTRLQGSLAMLASPTEDTIQCDVLLSRWYKLIR